MSSEVFFKITRKFIIVGVLLLLSACGASDIRDIVDMEYLQAKQAKPLVYPAGLDSPKESQTYSIPNVPASNTHGRDDINKLVHPPSLLTAEQRGEIGSLTPEEAKKKLKEDEKEAKRRAKEAQDADDEEEDEEAIP